MSKKELTHIKSESLSVRFKNHISDEFNERILFSGPFGEGKSTFLKNFFEENENYIVLKLYPVNYSVAPNQDVFEVIKYELLYELLNGFAEEVELNQEQFSMLLISQMFVLHKMNIDLPLKLLAKASSLLHGTAAIKEATIDSIIQTVNSLSDYKKDINESEDKLLKEHIKSVQKQKGHIYEFDDITKLILSLLERIKIKKAELNPNVKTVLLIDDLDRLDPEHVFRLFNIFSAHYDDVTEVNKFSFDKVIFVCDVKNIREMFSHRYGFNVEFTGYIDKFFSTEVFHFDIKKYLKESLYQILNESIYNPYKYFEQGMVAEKIVQKYGLKRGYGIFETFLNILKKMIDSNLIRIRNFKRFNEYTLPSISIQTKYGTFDALLFPISVTATNLEKLFIHRIDLENALENLYKNYESSYDEVNSKNRSKDDPETYAIIQQSLACILDEDILFDQSREDNKQYLFSYFNEKQQKIFIVYTMHYDWEGRFFWPKYVKITFDGSSVNDVASGPALLRPNPYWFLYNAYKNFRSRWYL